MKKGGKMNNAARLAPLSLPDSSVTALRRHTMPSPLPSPSTSTVNRHLSQLTPVAAPRPVRHAGGQQDVRVPVPQRRRSEMGSDAHRHLALSPLPDMTRVAHRRRIQELVDSDRSQNTTTTANNSGSGGIAITNTGDGGGKVAENGLPPPAAPRVLGRIVAGPGIAGAARLPAVAGHSAALPPTAPGPSLQTPRQPPPGHLPSMQLQGGMSTSSGVAAR